MERKYRQTSIQLEGIKVSKHSTRKKIKMNKHAIRSNIQLENTISIGNVITRHEVLFDHIHRCNKNSSNVLYACIVRYL